MERIKTEQIKAAKVLVFDFDGTLCNDYEELIKILNSLSDQFGYKITSPEKMDLLRDLPSEELFKSIGITPENIQLAVKNAVEVLAQRIHALSTFPGMIETLNEIKLRGYRLGVLSSNSNDNIEKFLQLNQIDSFEFIYSGSNVFGKHQVIEDLLKAQALSREEVVYIGDETRDIEAAKKAAVSMVAVSWGFNSRKILEQFRPDQIVDDPKELLEIFG